MTKAKRKLTRNKEKQIVLGLCAGLGDYLGIPVTVVRLIFIFLGLWGGGGVVLYIMLVLVTSPKGKIVENRKENAEEFVEDVGKRIRRLVEEEKNVSSRRGGSDVPKKS